MFNTSKHNRQHHSIVGLVDNKTVAVVLEILHKMGGHNAFAPSTNWACFRLWEAHRFSANLFHEGGDVLGPAEFSKVICKPSKFSIYCSNWKRIQSLDCTDEGAPDKVFAQTKVKIVPNVRFEKIIFQIAIHWQ